jgi:hypothetical protein
MTRSDRLPSFHSLRGEWDRRLEKDRPLGFHSLTGEWDQLRMGSD